MLKNSILWDKKEGQKISEEVKEAEQKIREMANTFHEEYEDKYFISLGIEDYSKEFNGIDSSKCYGLDYFIGEVVDRFYFMLYLKRKNVYREILRIWRRYNNIIKKLNSESTDYSGKDRRCLVKYICTHINKKNNLDQRIFNLLSDNKIEVLSDGSGFQWNETRLENINRFLQWYTSHFIDRIDSRAKYGHHIFKNMRPDF